MENLSRKNTKEIAKSSEIAVGVLHVSDDINQSRLKANRFYQIAISSSSISTAGAVDVFGRSFVLHGVTGRAILVILENTGYRVYGDISEVNGISLWEYQIG